MNERVHSSPGILVDAPLVAATVEVDAELAKDPAAKGSTVFADEGQIAAVGEVIKMPNLGEVFYAGITAF